MTTKILNVELTTETRDGIKKLLRDWLTGSEPHQIVTVNPEILVYANQNSAYKAIVDKADVRITDGAGILFVSKLLRKAIPERWQGVDLVDELANQAAAVGRSIYLVGGDQGVAKKAAAMLQKKHPNLRISGAEEGIPKLTDARRQTLDPDAAEQELVNRIRDAKPGVVLVAFGHPKQEFFIAKHKNELGSSILIGVGGTFDFLAGTVKRAPKLLQTLWLEWLWRLIVQPWRIKRIWTATIVFPWLAIKNR